MSQIGYELEDSDVLNGSQSEGGEEDSEDENEDYDMEEQDAATELYEKRRLRSEYRALQSRMEDSRPELVQSTSDGIREILATANSLFENVKSSQEAYLDSRILSTTARLTAAKVNNMRLKGRSLDTADFLRRLKHKISYGLPNATGNHSFTQGDHGDDCELDWGKLVPLVSVTGSSPATVDFLFGPLLAEPKPRKELKRNSQRSFKDESQKQTPSQLQESDIQKQENETSKSVHSIHKILKQVGPMNFFEFVVNPESFSQTVENIFYVSFLIRDGSAAIDIEDGQPILNVASADVMEDTEDSNVVRKQKQHIIELSFKMYQDLIEVYGISASIIPTRTKSNLPPNSASGGAKWYG